MGPGKLGAYKSTLRFQKHSCFLSPSLTRVRPAGRLQKDQGSAWHPEYQEVELRLGKGQGSWGSAKLRSRLFVGQSMVKTPKRVILFHPG